MKRIRYIMMGILFVSLFPVSSWAQVGENYFIELEGRYWRPKLDSTVKVEDNGIGTEIKLVDDLGMESRKDFYEGRAQIKFAKKHKFNLSYIPIRWEAAKNITKTIQFAGKTYSAGTRVQSKLDLQLVKGGYEYDFLAGKYGFLGASFDVMAANADVELKAPAILLDQEEEQLLPIPMIGLKGRIYPVKWVNVTGSVAGLPLGSYGYILDAEASVTINPVNYVGISGGYRYLRAKAEYQNDLFNFTLDGPFVALNIRF